MWIMTPFGFIAVAASDLPEWELQVRARDRSVLRKLRTRYRMETSRIIPTPERDYEFRMYCSRADLAEALRLPRRRDRLGEVQADHATTRHGWQAASQPLRSAVFAIAEHYDSPILGRYERKSK